MDYLYNRALTDKVIDKFDVGYCPKDVFHQLRGRIITPIYGTYGNLAALSTRYMEKDRKNRFWHESFDKGSYLYGLNCARDSIIKKNKVIIVEGEFDVLTLHSFGFDMTVGVCGSSLTLLQIGLLARFCSEFYFMLDGDAAGNESIIRINRMYERYDLKQYGLSFYSVALPKGYDPDDYVKEFGPEGMREKLISSKDNII